jgi:hypothetical protein
VRARDGKSQPPAEDDLLHRWVGHGQSDERIGWRGGADLDREAGQLKKTGGRRGGEGDDAGPTVALSSPENIYILRFWLSCGKAPMGY